MSGPAIARVVPYVFRAPVAAPVVNAFGTRDAGMWFCPHWLAGGVGLIASLHLCAAVGGDGLTEWDANPNPLREAFPLPEVVDGNVTLGDAPGLGFVPDLRTLEEFAVAL